jgi:hypothetical protein
VPGTLDAVLSARDSKGVAVDLWGEGGWRRKIYAGETWRKEIT